MSPQDLYMVYKIITKAWTQVSCYQHDNFEGKSGRAKPIQTFMYK